MSIRSLSDVERAWVSYLCNEENPCKHRVGAQIRGLDKTVTKEIPYNDICTLIQQMASFYVKGAQNHFCGYSFIQDQALGTLAKVFSLVQAGEVKEVNCNEVKALQSAPQYSFCPYKADYRITLHDGRVERASLDPQEFEVVKRALSCFTATCNKQKNTLTPEETENEAAVKILSQAFSKIEPNMITSFSISSKCRDSVSDREKKKAVFNPEKVSGSEKFPFPMCYHECVIALNDKSEKSTVLSGLEIFSLLRTIFLAKTKISFSLDNEEKYSSHFEKYSSYRALEIIHSLLE